MQAITSLHESFYNDPYEIQKNNIFFAFTFATNI